MKVFALVISMAVILVSMTPAPVDAGTMSRACMNSDRKAKSRQMCNCMQSVANKKLSRRDQATAAKFFKDPHKAQVIRQSDKRSDEQFWKRYKEYGQVFAASCKHLR